MRTAIVVLIIAVISVWFVYKGFAEYSTSPNSNIGLCYTENWSAAEFAVLNQKEAAESFEFFYAASSAPDSVGSQRVYDFVPVKWEVTGNVSFKN